MVLTDENWEKIMELFLSIGLDEKTARHTINNKKVTSNLSAVIHEAGVTNGCDRTTGNLLYSVTTKFPANALGHRPTLLKYIVTSKIRTPAQLEAAISFLKEVGSMDFKLNEFEQECGVGIEVSPEDIDKPVKEILEENKKTLLEQRYRIKSGKLVGQVHKSLPWADPTIIQKLIDEKMYGLYCLVREPLLMMKTLQKRKRRRRSLPKSRKRKPLLKQP